MFTPRKNRNPRKKIDADNEESTEAPDVDIPVTTAANTTATAGTTGPKPAKAKKKTTNTVLSFGDEEQASQGKGSEDAFKVKKSAASRKLALNKGRDDSLLDQHAITSRATVGTSTSYSKEALEELRKTTLSTAPSTRPHGNEDNADESSSMSHGASTIIPDAHAIYLAKKKREQLRLRNDREEEEFISLIGGDDDTMAVEEDKRLVREEDDDMDDGEADLETVMGDKLELGAKAQRHAEKLKRSAQRELIEDMDEDEEDEEETREWEMQQIRNAGIVKAGPKSKSRSAPEHKGVVFPAVTPIPNMAKVRSRIQDYLANLRDQHSQHTKQLDQIRHEEAKILLRTAEAEESMTKASERYTFFQELRSYCQNLAAFFEAKYPELEAIEQDYRSMLSDRTKLVIERRRLDLEDDLAEFSNVVDAGTTGREKDDAPEVDEFGRSVAVDPLAARKRRRAERERRLAQRRQSQANGQDRSPEGSKEAENHEGLDTDDELGAGDEMDLGNAVMELENRRVNMFQEVGSEFRSMDAVKKHFQAWKTKYPEDYNKAYGGLLLPLVFDFYVRQETCLWNPLRVTQDFSEQSWHRIVSSYTIIHPSTSNTHSDSEGDPEDDEEDMDKELMSKVVSKSVCPKITQFLTAGGVDLYSAKQTRCLKAILDQLLDYVDKKDNKMEQLLKAILQTILQTAQVHRDQFVEAAQPLTPRHILTAQGHEARERYLWRTIGLFRNLMLLRRFVPAGSMDTQVVDGLLHDCILRLLESEDKGNVAKYQMVGLKDDIRLVQIARSFSM
ncbi:hypothetical protein BGX31_005933 [Mortierella sp. GBA43]|nr:hypothetical protein BGX31_005933 [Mortierella sp. GBA43]